jgi:hypothetical protein
MKKEVISRLWRLVYANSHEKPFCDRPYREEGNLSVMETTCRWEAKRLFWRFYVIVDFSKR